MPQGPDDSLSTAPRTTYIQANTTSRLTQQVPCRLLMDKPSARRASPARDRVKNCDIQPPDRRSQGQAAFYCVPEAKKDRTALPRSNPRRDTVEPQKETAAAPPSQWPAAAGPPPERESS